MILGKHPLAVIPLAASQEVSEQAASTISDSVLISAATEALQLGENTIRVWVDDDEANAVAVTLNIDSTLLGTIFYEDTTLIDGGRIHPGSSIMVGNLDGQSDYCILTAGQLKFYRYIAGDHRFAKALKKVETGVAVSGEDVTLPDYWKGTEPPAIHVSAKDVPSFDPNYDHTAQSLVCDATNIVMISEGRWKFTPTAKLVLSSGNVDNVINQEEVISSSCNQPPRGDVYATEGTAVAITESNVTNLTVRGQYGSSAFAQVSGVYSDTNGDIDPYDQHFTQPFRARLEYMINGTYENTDYVEFNWDFPWGNAQYPEHSILNSFNITVTSNNKTYEPVDGTTIDFVDGGAGADTITDSASGFLTAGFAPGDVITVAGSTSNDGDYTIVNVTAGTITLATAELASDEVGIAGVSLTAPGDPITQFRLRVEQQYFGIDADLDTFYGVYNYATITSYSADFTEGSVLAEGSVHWMAIGE